MRHLTLLGSLGFCFLAASSACTPKSAETEVATASDSGPAFSQTHRQVQQDREPAPGTNHRFTPRAHEPHLAPPSLAPPALHALPRFVDGSQKCFPPPRPIRPMPRRKYGSVGSAHGSGSMGLSSQGFGSGHGRLGGSHKTSAPKIRAGRAEISGAPAPQARSKPKRVAPPPPASAPTPSPVRPPSDGYGYSFDDEALPSRTVPQEERVAPGPDWGASIYLSNDDTMSLSSAQRLIFAIDQYAPISQEHVRPHEWLNYFSFDTQPVQHDHDFSVVPNIARSTEDPNVWSLGFAVQGRPLTTQSRRNANLSYVIDRSGSMRAEGRMVYLKRGLLRSIEQLKTGDIVHLNLFDSSSCQLAQNFVVGRDDIAHLRRLIQKIQPQGSTNLYSGLRNGYQVADTAYVPAYTNRVVLITDALTNTGMTDERLISLVGQHYDDRRIRLSGVGVGRDFNDSLLDRLTERGKGAYVFLGSDQEVDAVFGHRFVSLIETVANDVHFRVHLPPSLAMQTFYGEEASTIKERVQAIHYFANTSQMFLSDLISKDNILPTTDDIMFTIEYQDPETGAARVEEFAWNIGQIAGPSRNLDKAMLINRFARDVGRLAGRPSRGYGRYGWKDPEAYHQCMDTRADLQRLAAPLGHDPEVSRVTHLWDTYCGRYEVASRSPEPTERHNDFAPKDTWPSAQR